MTSIGPLGRRATLAAVLFAAGLASGAGVMAVLSARVTSPQKMDGFRP